jgi:serine/threonine protein kinase
MGEVEEEDDKHLPNHDHDKAHHTKHTKGRPNPKINPESRIQNNPLCVSRRDIHLGNILVRREEGGVVVAKLGDFGLSRFISSRGRTSDHVGNFYFRAP